jgi:phosphatidylinositol glycan class B
MFYCSLRTYSNSLEMCIGMIALALWLRAHEDEQSRMIQTSSQSSTTKQPESHAKLLPALGCAAAAVVIRPTSVITWIAFGCWYLVFCVKGTWSRVVVLSTQVVPVACIALAISAGLDTWFYQQFTVVQYNFAMLNVFAGVSSDYGTHPWTW